MNRIKLFAIVFLFCLTTTDPAKAVISFNQGKWQTSFNCPEWVQGAGLSCDGLGIKGSWKCSDSRGEHGDLITSGANYASGVGGRGFRHWKGDGVNNNGGGLRVTFPSPQKELWIRWYHRYDAGFKWSYLNYDKILYIYADSSQVIPAYKWSNEIHLGIQGGGSTPQAKNSGWLYVNNGSSISDGRFHAHEIHLKMDTNSANGIGRYWIDGKLIINQTNVNYSGGSSANRNGWINFTIGSNQREPSNGGCRAVDYDDMIIYNTTPPNRDASGYPFIGLAGSSSPTPPPLQPPRDFRIVQQ